jgi:hypothetical protein
MGIPPMLNPITPLLFGILARVGFIVGAGVANRQESAQPRVAAGLHHGPRTVAHLGHDARHFGFS